jgi:hypothetical protein
MERLRAIRGLHDQQVAPNDRDYLPFLDGEKKVLPICLVHEVASRKTNKRIESGPDGFPAARVWPRGLPGLTVVAAEYTRVAEGSVAAAMAWSDSLTAFSQMLAELPSCEKAAG